MTLLTLIVMLCVSGLISTAVENGLNFWLGVLLWLAAVVCMLAFTNMQEDEQLEAQRKDFYENYKKNCIRDGEPYDSYEEYCRKIEEKNREYREAHPELYAGKPSRPDDPKGVTKDYATYYTIFRGKK